MAPTSAAGYVPGDTLPPASPCAPPLPRPSLGTRSESGGTPTGPTGVAGERRAATESNPDAREDMTNATKRAAVLDSAGVSRPLDRERSSANREWRKCGANPSSEAAGTNRRIAPIPAIRELRSNRLVRPVAPGLLVTMIPDNLGHYRKYL